MQARVILCYDRKYTYRGLKKKSFSFRFRSLDQEAVSLWNLVVTLLHGISLLSSVNSFTLITLRYTFSSPTQQSLPSPALPQVSTLLFLQKLNLVRLLLEWDMIGRNIKHTDQVGLFQDVHLEGTIASKDYIAAHSHRWRLQRSRWILDHFTKLSISP